MAGQMRMSRASSGSHSAGGRTFRSEAKLLLFLFFFFLRNSICESGKHKPEKEKVEAGRARQTKHLGEKTSLIRGARCSAFTPSLTPSLVLFVHRSLLLFWSFCCLFGEPANSLPATQAGTAKPRTHMEHDPLTSPFSSSPSPHKEGSAKSSTAISRTVILFPRRLVYLPVRFCLRAASSLIRQN